MQDSGSEPVRLGSELLRVWEGSALSFHYGGFAGPTLAYTGKAGRVDPVIPETAQRLSAKRTLGVPSGSGKKGASLLGREGGLIYLAFTALGRSGRARRTLMGKDNPGLGALDDWNNCN